MGYKPVFCVEYKQKGLIKMIIAVATQGETIFQHFGKTPQFTLFETEDSIIKNIKVLDTGDSGHSALIDVLKENSAEVLICGGIGAGAVNGLSAAGIEVVSGVECPAKDAVIKYLSGEKLGTGTATCDHHHEGGQTCGEHTCK